MKLQHVCMFLKSDNENGFIQCTIKPIHKRAFEALGFVDDVEFLPKDEPKKRKRRSKEEMERDKLSQEVSHEYSSQPNH